MIEKEKHKNILMPNMLRKASHAQFMNNFSWNTTVKQLEKFLNQTHL